jgi:Activator of Hsp90 ATPase homolog 1-like protein
MKKQDYTTTILVRATANNAFKSINHVAAWWTENIEGSSEKLNDVFTVHFGETFATMKIVESVPEERVVWHVTDCHLQWLADKKEWKDTRIVFEISTEGDSVRIQFTHVGLTPQVECYNDCVKGWDQYIKGSLAKLIIEGKGHPERKKMAAAGAEK